MRELQQNVKPDELYVTIHNAHRITANDNVLLDFKGSTTSGT